MDFVFKKKFGQNFLKDENLLSVIVIDAQIDGKNVLEIGPGAGALTERLCKKAKRVLCVEIDKTLEPILLEKLNGFSNVKLIFNDILKMDISQISEYFNGEPICVVANLPYYISTPILFWLIKSGLNILSVTVMLQREFAERICAQPNTKEYGSISVVLSLWGDVSITRDVSRKLFYPVPDVDSSVLHIDVKKHNYDILKISKVVKFCFAMRRKTLINNLMVGANLDRNSAEKIIEKLNFDKNIRAENLCIDDYINLANLLNDTN